MDGGGQGVPWASCRNKHAVKLHLFTYGQDNAWVHGCMSARKLFLLICVTLLGLGAGAAHAKRIALVIGNDNYLQVTRLEKAGNDADTMARELEAAGFEVKKYRDLTFKQTVGAVEGVVDKSKGGDAVDHSAAILIFARSASIAANSPITAEARAIGLVM